MSVYFLLDLAVSLVAFLWLYTSVKRRSRGFPYPPGPIGLPVIGNYLELATSSEWIQAADFSRLHGDLVFTDKLGTKILYVNSYSAAVDLLEKRSRIYSSRSKSVILSELEGWDYLVTTMPYNDRMRRHRAYYHRFFNPAAVNGYKPLQLRETHKMLARISKTPGDFFKHVRLMSGAVIMMITYGREANDNEDPQLVLSNIADVLVGEVKGFKYLVDLIPWLKYVPRWVPGAGFQKKAKEARKVADDLLRIPLETIKTEMREGTAKLSFASQLIVSNTDEFGNIRNEIDIAGATALASAAGSDSTAAATLTFILHAVLTPDIQKKGQEEVDRVLGKDTLPTFDDRENLPYVDAICKECLRWEAITPLGVAHSLDIDDYYNGYFIPAGTAVVPNQWAMLRDPREYPNPDKFMPERWLAENGGKSLLNPNKIAFGFGRRICPGKILAENSLFITVASLLATFNFEKATDESGKPITPTGDYDDSLIRGPKPFACKVSVPASGFPSYEHHTMIAFFLLDLAVSLAVFLWVRTLARRRSRGLPYPPGPKGLPVIGNYLELSTSCEWEQAADFSRLHGDLVFTDKLGTKILYVNSYSAAVDLLEKRSRIYSSRSKSVILSELEGWDYLVTTMPYNDRMRRHRAYYHRFFNLAAVNGYKPLQLRETHKMLARILKTPDDFFKHIRLMSGAVIMMIAYGREVDGNDDPQLVLANVADVLFGEVKGFAYLVDLIPWLKYVPEWVPGAGFQRKAREARRVADDLLRIPLETIKTEMREGTAKPSFASQLIESNTDELGNIRHEIDIAGATAVASAGRHIQLRKRTAAATFTFILQALLTPDIQKKGQEEIVRVLGKDILPTFDDREILPYVDAICKECLRWEAIAPLGVAHSSDVDDYYNGYFIPAGTTVVPNQWAMLRDPREYPNPDKFMPERWLAENGGESLLNPNKIAFGFGRRICPGKILAENSLFITVASLLAVFNFEKAVDASGKQIAPAGDYDDSLVRGPKPFVCKVSARSEGMSNLIRALAVAETALWSLPNPESAKGY
ncbi:hypothetical protein M0805_006166 [Coniferiporia weirii]|nr:hypothetical protein M0805_006166 [Coniferiporia weirii]